MCSTCRANQLVELHLNRFGVAILGALNQKHHDERNDRRRCIDDQLPRVAETKQRTRQNPHQDGSKRQNKYGGAAAEAGGRLGEVRVPGACIHG